jgi:hypothetical protein
MFLSRRKLEIPGDRGEPIQDIGHAKVVVRLVDPVGIDCLGRERLSPNLSN